MSYQVIAGKWRPQSFLELVGQEHVSQSLLNALKSGRVPQAVLFTGTRGVGKTSSARIFAKSLRCPNSTDFIPCNTCETCVGITSGSSIDVMEIDGASNNGVDAIREIRDSVAYMPASGKYKIYIIDEVHMLSNSAFNALLKTLEEPPAHVIFVFATTEPQKIPATILSRCQRYDFKKISSKNIATHLEKICNAENIAFEPSALWLIARQADGSLRDALSFLDLAISFCEGKLNSAQLQSVLGITDRGILFDCLEALAARNPKEVLTIVERLQQTSLEPKTFADSVLQELRNLLFIKVNPPNVEDLVDLSEEELKRALTLTEQMSEEDIHFLFDMALKGANDIPKAQDPRVVLEMVLLRMANAPRLEYLFYTDSPAHAQPTEAPQKKNPKKDLNLPKAEPIPEPKLVVAAKAEPLFAVKDVVADWTKWVEVLKEKDALLAVKLQHVAPVSIKENKLDLAISKGHEFLLPQLQKETEHLVQYIKELTGTSLSIHFGQQQNEQAMTPKQLADKHREQEEESIRKTIESDPLYVATQNVFKPKNSIIKELK
ncbi:MAG: DNA polymerase III subunit gamma/tau [Bdellovibrionales bacterium]|nr:DNA polymerase III subunit gamma/tau [Bdellovibrionales bacterium]